MFPPSKLLSFQYITFLATICAQHCIRRLAHCVCDAHLALALLIACLYVCSPLTMAAVDGITARVQRSLATYEQIDIESFCLSD